MICDFWGITRHHETNYEFFKTKYGYVPEHIQSSFMAIRNKMLNSDDYKSLCQ
ncbi:rhamnan synthesis F family protein [Paenibacillus baimaensis]|uniref:rhamnan synthesis F family protein n=1 Tax=Paenibacillus baimaensis TaxID=2982185 RepID=UPI0038CD836F